MQAIVARAPKPDSRRSVRVMTDKEDRLMEWQPDAPDFTRDETILAIILQSAIERFSVADVIKWLGPPDLILGNSMRGSMAYHFDSGGDTSAMLGVADNKIFYGGTVSRFCNNAVCHPHTEGQPMNINIFDRMTPYTEAFLR